MGTASLKHSKITVTNLDIVTQDNAPNIESLDKGDDSFLTRMGNMVALLNTSDKTTKTTNPTVATKVTKSVSLISELTDDLQTGMQLLLLQQEMCEALE